MQMNKGFKAAMRRARLQTYAGMTCAGPLAVAGCSVTARVWKRFRSCSAIPLCW